MSKTTSPDLPEREIKFLTKMMEREMRGDKEGVTYEMLRVELNIGQRVKSQMDAWKNLINVGYIELKSGKQYTLTSKGLDLVASPEYKEYIKDLNIVSATNEDHQNRIKKHLSPKHQRHAIKIFDFLQQYGSLTTLELAALCGTKRGSHGFSYGLQELKNKNYIEDDPTANRKGKGKMLRLSDKAFLTAADRPTPESIDTEELAKAVELNMGRKRGSCTADDDSKEALPSKKKAKVKKEAVKEETNEESDHVKSDDPDVGNVHMASVKEDTDESDCEKVWSE
jgi:hypothetical protein